jgi:hypothetical protein
MDWFETATTRIIAAIAGNQSYQTTFYNIVQKMCCILLQSLLKLKLAWCRKSFLVSH